MNQHEPFLRAKHLYEQHGGDLAETIVWSLQHGVVVSTPESFLMGYFFREGSHETPVPREGADGVFVVLAAGKPKPSLHQLVEMVPLLAYERSFRGDSRTRILDIKKYYNLL